LGPARASATAWRAGPRFGAGPVPDSPELTAPVNAIVNHTFGRKRDGREEQSAGPVHLTAGNGCGTSSFGNALLEN
jgi:hypothetical protein